MLTVGDDCAATQKTRFAQAVVTQQGHPGPGGQFHLVAMGHALVEYVAAVEAVALKQLHDLGVVLYLRRRTAEVSLRIRSGYIYIYRSIYVYIYHSIDLATGRLFQIASILGRHTLPALLGRQETLLDVRAGGERHALTPLPVRCVTVIAVGYVSVNVHK